MINEKGQKMLTIAGFDVVRLVAVCLGITVIFLAAHWLPLWSGEPSLAPMLNTTAIILFFGLASHFIIRLFFPQIILKDFAKTALANPIGAAIVFASVCVVLCCALNAFTSLLK